MDILVFHDGLARWNWADWFCRVRGLSFWIEDGVVTVHVDGWLLPRTEAAR